MMTTYRDGFDEDQNAADQEPDLESPEAVDRAPVPNLGALRSVAEREQQAAEEQADVDVLIEEGEREAQSSEWHVERGTA
jgi:hypothetical protein